MIKIDNPTWYYLQEANNGLFELLQFLNSDDVSTDELEKLSINEEQKENMNEYYNYVRHSLQKLRKSILEEIKEKTECIGNNTKVTRIKHYNDSDESYCTINFTKSKSAISMYIGLYCAKDVYMKKKPIENPVLSIAFYNDNCKKTLELKENIENKLDFYNAHKDIFITSLDIEIKNQKDFEKECENIVKFAVDIINKL